ncbi:MAG: ABC transporter ATP-binding protein [Candidatus Zixiibacteriota bacterium]
MIRADNLRKRYGALTAVDGVSFAIHPGETFGLLGPNGAGKTTTINLIVGSLVPDAGAVFIDGKADPTNAAVRRQIGYAPQALALYEELTAHENLAFFGRLYGLESRRLRERVDYALDLAGLTDRRGDKVTTFSGGMKRRLNIACAIVADPPVLLLDEPTAGVDPQSRNLIFDKIALLRRQGRTIVYTTHYMEEAQRLCDRVAIMDHGRILALDTVERLIELHGGTSVIEAELDAIPDNLESMGASIDGDRLRLETDRPLEELARLTGSGMRLRTLRLDRADLETVFLNLTGRRLRD